MKIILVNNPRTGVRLMLLTALLLMAGFGSVNAQDSDFAEVVSDLAAIQLMEAQPKTTITDDQVTELAPVLGNAFYGIMQVAWENVGKKLRPGQKIGVARKLKSIQGNLQKGLEQVLTPEQLQAWEAHKAEKSG